MHTPSFLVQMLRGFASCIVSICLSSKFVLNYIYFHETWNGSLLLTGMVESTDSYHQQEIQKHQELDYLGKGHQLFLLVFNNASGRW